MSVLTLMVLYNKLSIVFQTQVAIRRNAMVSGGCFQFSDGGTLKWHSYCERHMIVQTHPNMDGTKMKCGSLMEAEEVIEKFVQLLGVIDGKLYREEVSIRVWVTNEADGMCLSPKYAHRSIIWANSAVANLEYSPPIRLGWSKLSIYEAKRLSAWFLKNIESFHLSTISMETIEKIRVFAEVTH